MEQDWDLGRRLARVTLAASGLVLLLTGARPSTRTRGPVLTPNFLPDELVLLLALAALVGLFGAAIVIYIAGHRHRWPWLAAGAAFTRTFPALALVAAITGAGTGAFAGFCMEIEGDEGGAAVMCIAVPIFLGFVISSERGTLWRVLASISIAWPTAAIAAALRLAAGGVRRHYYDEIFIATLLGWPATLMIALGVLGLVKLYTGRLGVAAAAASGALPLELLARDGTFVVRVEAPGLSDASRVRTWIEGRRLRLEVPRAAAATGEVVFTTRPSGLFTSEVLLPGDVDPRPLSVEVKDGLVSIALAPLPAQSPAI